jgi:CDP-diacylglycerol--glycerol-3-phosphate 3-phosphatidyltransferase
MFMTNESIRLFPHDYLMKWVIEPWFPRRVKPNHLTVLRFFLTPLVLWLIWRACWSRALVVFLFAAFTDALDGSLARLRRQITTWGTVADPVADKILIGSVAVAFVARVVGLWLAGLVLCMELLIVLGALYRRSKGKMSSANVFGKTKMCFQVIGVSLLLLAEWMHAPALVTMAIASFLISLAFAFISFVTYSF